MGAGAFNPAIIHPMWLAEKDLLDASSAEVVPSPSANPPCIVTPRWRPSVPGGSGFKLLSSRRYFPRYIRAGRLISEI